MTLEQAHLLTLRILKQVMEEKLNEQNIQLAQVTKEKGFEILGDEATKALVAAMPI